VQILFQSSSYGNFFFVTSEGFALSLTPVVSEVLSSCFDSIFTELSCLGEVSPEVGGLSGLGLGGGMLGEGFVISWLGRGLALGAGGLGEAVVCGGRGRVLGCGVVVIGPTIILDGTIFGAGAGM
jgi:hypothetical protein